MLFSKLDHAFIHMEFIHMNFRRLNIFSSIGGTRVPPIEEKIFSLRKLLKLEKKLTLKLIFQIKHLFWSYKVTENSIIKVRIVKYKNFYPYWSRTPHAAWRNVKSYERDVKRLE